MTFLANGQISWGFADTRDVKSTSGQPIVFGDDANITARLGMRLEYNEQCYNLQFQTNLYYVTLVSREATFATTMSIEDNKFMRRFANLEYTGKLNLGSPIHVANLHLTAGLPRVLLVH